MEWGSGCRGLPTAAGKEAAAVTRDKGKMGWISSAAQQHRGTESEAQGNTPAQTTGCEEVAPEGRPPAGQTGNCLQVYACVYRGTGIAITVCIEN